LYQLYFWLDCRLPIHQRLSLELASDRMSKAAEVSAK
jgi:hypothetical protein